MRKKIAGLLTVIAVVMLMTVMSTETVSAASWNNYRGIKWSIDMQNGQLTIAPGQATGDYAAGDMGDSIPSYECWRSRAKEASKIVIEDGVTRIGNNAFAGMEKLTEVTIADSVKCIGEYAFQEDTALVSLDMGEGVEEIGQYAFSVCSALKEVSTPASLNSIGQYAFSGCTSLEKLTFTDGLEEIAQYGFRNCISLADVSMADSIQSVGKDAFLYAAFVDAQKENELVICDNVVLGNHLEDLSVTTCMIPEGITCIADYAFEGTSMNELELPESLRYIGKYSFSGRSYSSHDSRVEELDFKNVGFIDNGAFQYWHYIESADLSNVTYLGDNAFYWCNKLASVKLAENMDYLGADVFVSCKTLNTIEVPKCVKSVDINSFSCKGAAKDKIYHDENGDGFYYHEGMLLQAKAVSGVNYGTDIVIEDGTYIIANRAFSQFNPTETITSITIPESVKYIGDIWIGSFDIKDIYYAGDKNSWKKIQIANDPVNNSANNLMFSNAEIHYAKSSATDLSDCTVTLEYSKTEYTGEEKTPNVTVKNPDGAVLKKDIDYKVTFVNNVNAGTATVNITGLEDYCGTVTKEFEITDVKAANVTAKLSFAKATYNGKQKTPTVTVKDANGNTLVKDTDYTVTFANTTRKGVGRYKVTVTLKNNYSGTKTLWFTIVPNKTSTVKVSLVEKSDAYNDVLVRWDYVTGASGYYLYYKKNAASAWSKPIDYGKTRTATLNNLADGTQYNIKITAYYKASNGTKYTALNSRTSNIWTLKKVTGLTVKKYNASKVKISWKNINGETGYEIRRMVKNGNTYVAKKFHNASASASSIVVTAPKGTTYYYQIRAYKTVNNRKVYAPWSAIRSFKLSK